MRLFYAGDLHGSERCYRKFLNAAAFYDAGVLVLGGDIAGKLMVPIVEETSGKFVATMFGRTERIKRQDQLEDLEKRIRFNGFYPYRCNKDEYERLVNERAYQERVMSEVMIAEVRRWMSIADEKLSSSGVRCFIMPGNDDELEIDAALQSEVVENPDGRVVSFEGYQMLSSSWANTTPWDSPREANEERLAEIFEGIAEHLEYGIPTIFNLHVPPYDSGLDTAFELDEELNVVTSAGQPKTIPVGSHAARSFIEKHRPLLALHGHIHESKNVARIGRTLCINPGSNYADGVLDGAIIDLEDGTVVRHQLVSG
jgi:Icc-related predicted phosphoesterase